MQHCAYISQYQRFTNNITQKVITFLSPREQREREIFEDFSAGYQGLIESLVFANPFVVSTFTAQKKPVG